MIEKYYATLNAKQDSLGIPKMARTYHAELQNVMYSPWPKLLQVQDQYFQPVD